VNHVRTAIAWFYAKIQLLVRNLHRFYELPMEYAAVTNIGGMND
jgi:hypothetical protein